jgi:REP element-mobilizing transposase RayT
MAQRRRQDVPGALHHVYARGIARRTVFESVRDVRVFLCLLALEARRGCLEIVAFCFMTTHVHLVLRSVHGELSRALRRVFNGYVRWFNRSRRRDGSLFRGRFGSRRIYDLLDLLQVVAYVDDNPVEARLASHPASYAHGSAGCWKRGKAPPWLDTDTLARLLGVQGPGGQGAWAAYEHAVTARRGPRNLALVEARWVRRDAGPEPLDDLLGAAPERVLAWMVRKAALADQTRPGLPVLDVETVDEAWAAGRTALPRSIPRRSGPPRDVHLVGRVALLRDLAGLRYAAIAVRTHTSATTAHGAYTVHAQLVRQHPAYAEAYAQIVRAALASVSQIGHAARP